MKRIFFLILVSALTATQNATAQEAYPFRNPELPLEKRVRDLVSRLTLEEKIAQMQNSTPAIERLGIPAYDWWNECLHGVARSGDKVTVFPQAIGMAATFDAEAIETMGEMTSAEARAIYNKAVADGKGIGQYKGLTFWTPNINIFRDPRWGRGQETYGEDPYLTGLLGKAIVRGLQGSDATYLRVSACAKHFAVHSGPESSRHTFDATASTYDLWDTYLPAFRDLVVDGGVTSVMGAYNRFEGQPCCASDYLMDEILRGAWGFTGYVTSDCGAIDDFFKNHRTHPDAASAAADAVLHGTDTDCGRIYASLGEAVARGLITEDEIDISVARLFLIRFRLGMFDPAGTHACDQIPYSLLENDAHARHALRMAQESIVLLKNDSDILPLDPAIRKIVVLGPNANAPEVQLGNYNGFPTQIITPLEGIGAKTPAEVVYLRASNYTTPEASDEELTEALKGADAVIYIGGISPRLEGEEGDAGKENLAGFAGGDRTSILLPEAQTEVMRKVKAAGHDLIFVSMSGSALAFPWEAENADAIVQAWYGGQTAGTALADVLFGDYNPSGRLPVTFYRGDDQLPAFEDYSMDNRTYRYFRGEPLYEFGFGLSYTAFAYDKVEAPATAQTGKPITVSTVVQNTGKRTGEEVVQLYLAHDGKAVRKPIRALKGVKRVKLAPGESKRVEFVLTPRELALTDEKGNLRCTAGILRISIGGGQPTQSDAANKAASIKLRGKPLTLPR